MSATINVYDQLTWSAELIPDHRGSYVILRGTGPDTTLTLIRPTVDGLDGLIRAALTAKDLTAVAFPAEYVEQPPPDAGDSDEPPELSRDLSGDLDAIPPNQIDGES